MKVVSRAPLTRGRADTETFRCQVDRSHRAVYPGVFYAVYFMRSILLAIQSEVSRYLSTITAIKACLGLAVGIVVGLLGLRNPVHNTHGQMRPLGGAVRLFGKVSRAGTYFIWSPRSCR